MNYECCDGMTYTVKNGDTLYNISRMHSVPLAMILRANPYVDVYNLKVGDTICIPVSKGRPKPAECMMDKSEDYQDEVEPDRNMQANVTDENVSQGDVMETDSSDIVRYVVQAGDTLADIIGKSAGDVDSFLADNSLDRMYMLPGVAYYIKEK